MEGFKIKTFATMPEKIPGSSYFAYFYAKSQSNFLNLISKCETESTYYVPSISQVKSMHALNS